MGKSDYECALFLRHCGLTNTDIGKILKLPTAVVNAEIGCAKSYRPPDGYREQMAVTWGQIADNFATVGSA